MQSYSEIESNIKAAFREHPEIADNRENRAIIRAFVEKHNASYNLATLRVAIKAQRAELEREREYARAVEPAPVSPSSEPSRPGGYHSRGLDYLIHLEETETPAPGPKRTIHASVEKVREVIAAIQAEDRTFLPSDKNIRFIFSWLQDNDAAGGFTLENVRTAVMALSYPIAQLERIEAPPRPPSPAAPKPEPEKLESWQLPLTATRQQLRNASPEALKDYLRRAREAQKK